MSIYSFSDVQLNPDNESFLADMALALEQLSRLKQVKSFFKALNKTKWYFVLGHHGAGKTQFIEESEHAIIHKWQDAKNQFNFYFCDKKVFVEIAEKHLVGTQSELMTYRIVKLLKKYRANLSGFFILLSLHQQLTLPKAQRQNILNDAKRMNHAFLKAHPMPFWIIFSYLDIINGFKEFFNDLLDIERQQTFGLEIREAEKGADLIELFNKEFQMLLDHINQRLIRCLHHIRDQDQRMLANDFPIQFEQTASLIRNVIRQLFKQEQSIQWLKGIYFVSNKQVNNSIDRIVKPIAKKVVLSTPFISAKRQFSRAFFSHEILKKNVLNHSTGRVILSKEIWRVAQLGIAGTALGLTFFLAYNFKTQVDKLSQIENGIQSYKHQMQVINAHNDHELIELLGAIENINRIKNSMRDMNGAWMMLPFMENLNQLNLRVSHAYKEVLTRQFIPRMSIEFENILNNMNHYSDEELYSALKGYIMLMDKKRFDAVYISLWFRMHWEKYKTDVLTKAQIQRYSEQLYDLLKQMFQPAELNHQLVFKARQRLKNLSLPKVVFLKVKSLSDHSGYHLTRINNSPIPAVFTKKGYQAIYLPQVRKVLGAFDRGDWVLGHLPEVQPGQLTIMRDQIDNLYFDEYRKWWRKEVQTLSMPTVKNLQDAEHISLEHAKINNELLNVINALILNTKPFAEKTPVYQGFNHAVANHFKSYHQIKTESLAKLVQNFYELGHDIQLINTASDPDEQAFLMVKARFMAKGKLDPLSHLFEVGQALPAEIARPFKKFTRQVWLTLIRRSEQYVDEKWQTEIMPFYKDKIVNRYPLLPKSRLDIQLKDFSSFFAYGGKLDKFFDDYVKPFLKTKATRWKHHVKNDYYMSFSESMIEQFERAYIIRKMFFTQNSAKPYFEFSLQPVKFSPSVSSVVIDFSGQQVYDYQGSHKKTTFKWPSESGSNYITILLENYKGDIDSIKFVGPWALLRLMRHYQYSTERSIDTYALHFSAKHGVGDYVLKAHSKINPFIDNIIDKFSLSHRLFDLERK